jgi:hypothetical protein
MSDPFKITSPDIIAFSGGRTSAYLLHRILESNNGLPEDTYCVFANTGKEMEPTLEFVEDCSRNWKVPIDWVEYSPEDPGYRKVDFKSASRKGEPFEAFIRKRKNIPNKVIRSCTIELKVRPIHKLVKKELWKGKDLHHNERMNIMGIRADEMRRAAKIERERVPLVSAGIVKQDVGTFWKNHSFDLKLPNIKGETIHGNCDLCFLKANGKIQSLIREKPERADWWIKQETFTKDQFDRLGMSYEKRKEAAINQVEMFEFGESIPCYCGD